MIDLFSKTAEGVKNTAQSSQKDHTRVRKPRVFSDKSITNYEEKEAVGAFLVSTLDDGAFKEDVFVDFFMVDREQTVLLTNNRIVMCDVQKETVAWDVEFQGTFMNNNNNHQKFEKLISQKLGFLSNLESRKILR